MIGETQLTILLSNSFVFEDIKNLMISDWGDFQQVSIKKSFGIITRIIHIGLLVFMKVIRFVVFQHFKLL